MSSTGKKKLPLIFVHQTTPVLPVIDPLPPLDFVSTDRINQLPIAFAKNIARRFHLAATLPKQPIQSKYTIGLGNPDFYKGS
jgi:hypothetical protein